MGSEIERRLTGRGALALLPGEPAPAGIRRIADARAQRALSRLAAVEAEGAPAVHAARKELKKLRAILRLVRERLGERSFRFQNRRFRDAGRLLAESRDAEVRAQALADLERRCGDELPAAVAPWRAALERERYAATADPAGKLAGRVREATALIALARTEIGSWSLGEDSWELVEPGVLSAYREGRWAFAAVSAEPRAEAIHAWRKRTKDLWYQLRVLVELWPGLLGETAAAAHELSERLGEHHDLALLAADLGRRDVLEPEPIRALIARRQEELLAPALATGARLYAEKPKAFGKRLAAYWRAARG